MLATLFLFIVISTHAPLARRDQGTRDAGAYCQISTHAPLARRDSTVKEYAVVVPYFYSRASREARPKKSKNNAIIHQISTHAPLARRDLGSWLTIMLIFLFLLPRLSRGATWQSRSSMILRSQNFYSRASREARQFGFLCRAIMHKFLLTRLSRGATPAQENCSPSGTISTHAPLARRDVILCTPYNKILEFLLTRLSRGATVLERFINESAKNYYSRASREARLAFLG